LLGRETSLPKVPENEPDAIAGEGFCIFPTIMITPVTKRLLTDVKMLPKITVFPLTEQLKLLTAREFTVAARQVALLIDV
jgi:hypothetical protein